VKRFEIEERCRQGRDRLGRSSKRSAYALSLKKREVNGLKATLYNGASPAPSAILFLSTNASGIVKSIADYALSASRKSFGFIANITEVSKVPNYSRQACTQG
jgi:hypothetical protein